MQTQMRFERDLLTHIHHITSDNLEYRAQVIWTTCGLETIVNEDLILISSD